MGHKPRESVEGESSMAGGSLGGSVMLQLIAAAIGAVVALVMRPGMCVSACLPACLCIARHPPVLVQKGSDYRGVCVFGVYVLRACTS